jgi:hypothetical protein
MLDTNGPSHPIVTTIITTQNNDRFSGKLINSGLRLEADFMTTTYQPEDINRMEFTGDEKKDVKVLLASGDIIAGVLKLDEIIIAPDSLSRLTISKSGLTTVQFNARKMVLKDEKGCWATPDILFDFDSTEIKPRYHSALEVIIAVLKKNPGIKIEIQGHTDNTGPESYNQMLSEKRALAVKEYIVNKGIESDRIKAVGFGATQNVASNETDAGRALNRRIDFVPIN